MPKCGSSSVLEIINDLSDVNEFDVEGTAINHALDDQDTLSIKYTMHVMKTKDKLVWSNHFYYVDFNKFNFNPILMNVVRDPVQRMISKEMPILL